MSKMAKAVVKTAAIRKTISMVPIIVGATTVAGKAFVHDMKRKNQKKKGEITMKKSTLVSLVVFLAAIAGALGAAYLYLVRREKELDEYEQMLFSEDYEDTDDFCCGDCGDCEEGCTEVNTADAAPAEPTPEEAE